jgi:hypothetical protein
VELSSSGRSLVAPAELLGLKLRMRKHSTECFPITFLQQLRGGVNQCNIMMDSCCRYVLATRQRLMDSCCRWAKRGNAWQRAIQPSSTHQLPSLLFGVVIHCNTRCCSEAACLKQGTTADEMHILCKWQLRWSRFRSILNITSQMSAPGLLAFE